MRTNDSSRYSLLSASADATVTRTAQPLAPAAAAPMANSTSKWDQYYMDAAENDSSPPWESLEPFKSLKLFFDGYPSGTHTNALTLVAGKGQRPIVTGTPPFIACEHPTSQLCYCSLWATPYCQLLLELSPVNSHDGPTSNERPTDTGGGLSMSTLRAIELGCGSSASSAFLADIGFEVVAIDISHHALERAQKQWASSAVHWVQADIMSVDFHDQVRQQLPKERRDVHESFDFVFDMQCFHVLRSISESQAASAVVNLMKPGGLAMVVTGAKVSSDPASPINVPGPVMLYQDELLGPFVALGLQLVDIRLSAFNVTPHYLKNPNGIPKCWVALFIKPSI